MVLLQGDHVAELEIVFELYCELWDLAEDLPPPDARRFVLDELAHCGVSDDVGAVLSELRELPYVDSGPGTMSDRDSMWFGLQIMLNQLMHGGKRLLAPDVLQDAGALAFKPTVAPSSTPH